MEDISLSDPNVRVTTDQKEIEKWVKEHGGRPAIFDDPGAKGDKIGIRIDFTGKQDEKYMQEAVETEDVQWDKFFEIFEKMKLAFAYKTKDEPQDLTLAYKFVPRKSI